MLKILQERLKTGVATAALPALLPEGSARCPQIDPARCSACGACTAVCPAKAVQFLPGATTPAVDIKKCVLCGYCADACPAGAVQYNEPAHACESIGHMLTARVKSVLKKSLHIRHVDAGSCNACDWEMTALLNPIYDIQRFGVDFVASPRHADVLMVTGAVTRNLEIALRKTYAATPHPKLVVAVGACASGGGVFTGGYAVTGGADKLVPVDVYIPGCPPRPAALLYGLLLAVGKLGERK